MTKLRKKILLAILLADVCVAGLIFTVSGFYNTNVDPRDYIAQVEHFVNPAISTEAQVARREFKPLYGILGGALVLTLGLEAKQALVVINVLFFVALSFSFFYFLKVLDFEDLSAFIGTIWLISGYPLLKYGLSIGTDISGWFFAAITGLLGLYAFKIDKIWPLILASVLGFVGFLGKETGILGLGFLGFYILFNFKSSRPLLFLKRICAIGIPFVVLEGVFIYTLVTQGGITFFDWYRINAEGIHSYQTIRYFIGIEGAAFHLLLILGVSGFFFALRTRDIRKPAWISMYGALFLASLPVLFWPIYITRILYIQFLFIIPLALYGFQKIERYVPEQRRTFFLIVGASLPVLVSFGLFFLGNSRSLFDVFYFI